ncbi:MAG: tRNA (cytosine(32)/uridine(32)-2'-O)-methyltransferase TrmJ [Gammaproteobacteria bacterium]|nr:tRNA (cytosine(32)/uridine(32)-2'-O)-methyltransferase TrmJ [Gammaproteobacteria bacterium]
MFSNIRIVLVETSHPGNIGAAARAMKNMSLEHLYLVSPVNYPHADAFARAAGANDVLNNAVVVDSLEQAIADCTQVFGASARMRTLKWPQYSPAEAAKVIKKTSQTSSVALVFGRERTGLSNEELQLCHYLVNIPSNDQFSSLNLAAAVQVLAYELFQVLQQPVEKVEAVNADEMPVTQDEMQRYFKHLEEVLVKIDFLDPEHPKKLMRRLHRLYNRAQPDQREINILRGILSAVEKEMQGRNR